jgi:DNA-binding HxlR family transcriptional regulator/DNA-binding response OmpR family regulator
VNERDPDVVVATVKLISKKWHPVIIGLLLRKGPLRFSELKRSLDISAKVLTDSLDDLVENGLVERIEVSQAPRHVEYELTRHGQEMQSIIEALSEWGERHLGEDTRPLVLLVDDDPRLVSMHASWLEDEYRVERAYDGETAIQELTEDVDVVLLDRRMPGLSGDTVLKRIRELNYDCRVVVLSAVEPDFDVLDMGFDAYVVKPGTREELTGVIDDVLARSAYDEPVQEYLALNAKRALLRAEKPLETLRHDERYRQLEERLEKLAAEIDREDEEATLAELQTMLRDETGH